MSRPLVGPVSTTAQQHTGGFVAAKESHLMDGSSCAFRALHIALQLSRSLVSDLIVFLAPIPGISIEELRDLTKAMIGDPDPFRFETRTTPG